MTRWWRFVHDNKQHCYPWTSFVPNHHTLLTSIPTGSKLFTVIDLLSALFGTIVDEASQYPFAFPLEKQFTRTVMSQGYTEGPYFSQILKVDLENKKFTRVSTLLQMWIICFLSSFLNQNLLRKTAALKGFKITKEKLQFSSANSD